MEYDTMEYDDTTMRETPSNGRKASTTTELVAYDPTFAKPYYAMSMNEKKAWRRGNRKVFAAAGYGLTTVGGGTLFGGLEMLKGASLYHTATNIAGFEILTTAIFIIAAGLAALAALLPWEDA